jgi:hypothetical protein
MSGRIKNIFMTLLPVVTCLSNVSFVTVSWIYPTLSFVPIFSDLTVVILVRFVTVVTIMSVISILSGQSTRGAIMLNIQDNRVKWDAWEKLVDAVAAITSDMWAMRRMEHIPHSRIDLFNAIDTLEWITWNRPTNPLARRAAFTTISTACNELREFAHDCYDAECNDVAERTVSGIYTIRPYLIGYKTESGI